MLKKTLLATAVATVIFSGCSSKQYFEPTDTFSLSTPKLCTIHAMEQPSQVERF